MYKRLFFILLGLVLIALIYFTVISPATTPKERSSTTEKNNSAIEASPTKYEDKFCAQLSGQSDVPAKIDFIDVKSNLVFCKNDLGVMPILTNKEFTDVKKAFHALNFAEFKEELVERGYITWQADNFPKEKFSMISGFATDKVKTIIINSEDNIQPNKFFIGDNVWFWYVTFHKDKVNMPIKVTSYDAKGHNLTDVDE
ncbi:hypothetical protein AN964_22975 [Heyndrickxia shackletonii]|uniref:Uncharacterized protein n=1 Tax=Heyndrickxia shackletonii TaxID=157838 RepID=A0A0Q3WRI7_9BACI|nr:hypothetical protein [Heyndrickxia shackletonii]KQL50524.1 hypothetical protein AN964_22975 [Heyndrickxia shackletonii]NEY98169.1 hypothetical protein [Heyndrickxia shackletonii]